MNHNQGLMKRERRSLMVKEKNIIRMQGLGFLEKKQSGLRILHVKGTDYERGYQHGTLLADQIEECLKPGITMYALSLGRPWGQLEGGDYEKGIKQLFEIKEAMEPWVPPNIKGELHGIADALSAKGSNITYDDILLWNIGVDADLFFFHPKSALMDKPGFRTPYPAVACTTFCAFGKATSDGRIIYFKNNDFLSTPEAEENVYVMIAKPTDGNHGYFVPILPGLLGIESGMNDAGICFGINYSGTQPETPQGIGLCFRSELFLRFLSNIEDGISLANNYPRTGGALYHLADPSASKAIIIETTPNEIAVRSTTETDRDILWASNHFNCYPGWQGYKGCNMVTNQAKAYGLDDISTVDKWQESLEKCFLEEGSVGRYARLKQLLNENYGKITVEKALEIGGDRYDLKTKKLIGVEELYGFTTVSQFVAKSFQVVDSILYYKGVIKGPVRESIGNLWSWLAVPDRGDIWLADGPIPANRGEFHYFNLFDELESGK